MESRGRSSRVFPALRPLHSRRREASGAALGALRLWKPIGIVLVALLGSWMSEQYGVGAILVPLAVAQGLAVAAALLIHETPRRHESKESAQRRSTAISKRGHATLQTATSGWLPRDAGLWAFVVGDDPLPRRECSRRRLSGLVPQTRFACS